MKFLIVQLPPFSCHLIPLRSKYSSQNPVLRHPQSMLMAQIACRLPLTAEARVRARVSIRVGFLAEKVALGQAFLRVLRFFPVSIIPP
jgi:hypothetical protein